MIHLRPFHKTKKIGLCLSGGGARGLSHIGVIKALLEHNIIPTHISGASMGAIVAILYASGCSVEDMIHVAKHLGWKQILPNWGEFFGSKKTGFLSTKYLLKILKDLPYQQIEQLTIPTWISTTSISHGNNLLHHHGDIIPIITASCAIPGLFDPVSYDGHLLADGGISNNFPLEPLMDCDIIIGSDVNYYKPTDRSMKTKELISRSLRISLNQATVTKDEHCHLFIQPTNLHHYTILDFSAADEIISIGYQETIKQLNKHKLSQIL